MLDDKSSKFVVTGIILVIAAIAFGHPDSPLHYSTIQFNTEREAVENEMSFILPLAVIGDVNTKCFIKVTTYTIALDGSKLRGSSSAFHGGSAGVSPIIEYKFTQTFGGQSPTIKGWEVTPKIRCDKLDENGKTLSGNFDTLIDVERSTINLQMIVSHSQIGLKTFTMNPITTPNISLKNNHEEELGEFTPLASRIESSLPQTPNLVNHLKIQFNVDGKINLSYADTQGNKLRGWFIEVPSYVLTTTQYFNMDNLLPQTTPVQKRDATISIESVVRTTDNKSVEDHRNDIDTTKTSGKRIKVSALMRDYESSEGLPRITLKYGTKLLADKPMEYTGCKNDCQDGLFRFFYTFSQNSPNGEYTLTMTKTGRNGISTAHIYVNNADEVIEPTDTGSPSDINREQSDLNLPKLLDAKVNFAYLINYESGKPKEGTTSRDDAFDVELTLQNVLSAGNQEQNRLLKDIKLTPKVFFKDDLELAQYESSSSQLTFSPKIEVQDQVIPLKTKGVFDFRPQAPVCSFKDKDGKPSKLDTAVSADCLGHSLRLGSGIIKASDIQDAVEKSDDYDKIREGQKIPITLTVTANGDFTLRDSLSGRAYKSTVVGAEFVWTMNFALGAGSGGDGEGCPAGTQAKAISTTEFICIPKCPTGQHQKMVTETEYVCEEDDEETECLAPNEIIDGVCTDPETGEEIDTETENKCYDFDGNETECDKGEELEKMDCKDTDSCDPQLEDEGKDPEGDDGTVKICDGSLVSCLDALENFASSFTGSDDGNESDILASIPGGIYTLIALGLVGIIIVGHRHPSVPYTIPYLPGGR